MESQDSSVHENDCGRRALRGKTTFTSSAEVYETTLLQFPLHTPSVISCDLPLHNLSTQPHFSSGELCGSSATWKRKRLEKKPAVTLAAHRDCETERNKKVFVERWDLELNVWSLASAAAAAASSLLYMWILPEGKPRTSPFFTFSVGLLLTCRSRRQFATQTPILLGVCFYCLC